jgi:hypothetical protein
LKSCGAKPIEKERRLCIYTFIKCCECKDNDYGAPPSEKQAMTFVQVGVKERLIRTQHVYNFQLKQYLGIQTSRNRGGPCILIAMTGVKSKQRNLQRAALYFLTQFKFICIKNTRYKYIFQRSRALWINFYYTSIGGGDGSAAHIFNGFHYIIEMWAQRRDFLRACARKIIYMAALIILITAEELTMGARKELFGKSFYEGRLHWKNVKRPSHFSLYTYMCREQPRVIYKLMIKLPQTMKVNLFFCQFESFLLAQCYWKSL